MIHIPHLHQSYIDSEEADKMLRGLPMPELAKGELNHQIDCIFRCENRRAAVASLFAFTNNQIKRFLVEHDLPACVADDFEI